MPTSAVILAAGSGTRMRSAVPKVLHKLAGKPLLEHVINSAQQSGVDQIIVVTAAERPEVENNLIDMDSGVRWAIQHEQRGTADAVATALPKLPDDHRALVIYGDVPLIKSATLKKLLATPSDSIAWLTAILPNPHGLGRVVRDNDGNPLAMVEEKDADDAQKQISEVNSGVCLFPVSFLKKHLPTIDNNNSQKEFYLTDLFAIAISDHIHLETIVTHDEFEICGVNTREQLAALERVYQMEQAKKLMQSGVTLMDPARFDLRGQLTAGKDVTIDINVIVEGRVTIGNNCHIGPNVLLRDVTIGDDVTILANCVIEETDIDNGCQVGPFARLRPGTHLHPRAKIGNFVEIKKSDIGENSKVNHLSYIGDTQMGNHVNIGAGTITCNYDGANKHQTIIEDDAFIGSNNNLVAPVTIEKGATTGSGSTISKNAPKDALTVARAKQVTIKGWRRPKKDD
ncbi:MAG: UDP-N-acetylglucosamine diphosphorylase/glucosamine-1-phosphate N-acetyltransferase [Legionellaceae bacterium]|nr:UDP-N-acetylglucosamine diphosphorylase/glucosamine-1-phosphate N-acetyltransferase [Legionellaceae bacterium]